MKTLGDSSSDTRAMYVWHYTPWASLPKIVKTGALRPSNAEARHEAPLLWFSSDQYWEPTATKILRTTDGRLLQLTFDQQAERFGCVRFGLPSGDIRLLNWSEACRASGASKIDKRALERTGAKRGGTHKNWSATLCAIPLSELRFEVWVDRWSPCDSPEDMAAVWVKTRTTEGM